MQIEHRQEAVSDEHGRPVRLAAKKKGSTENQGTIRIIIDF